MSAVTIKPARPETADQVMKSVADALIDLPQTLSDQTSVVAKNVTGFTQDTVVTLARVTYPSAYFMAYAAVFSAVFVAEALPKRNPFMEGFGDGGKAATEAIAEH
jgi:hypothetical protein